jgi:hypothetical protein
MPVTGRDSQAWRQLLMSPACAGTASSSIRCTARAALAVSAGGSVGLASAAQAQRGYFVRAKPILRIPRWYEEKPEPCL